MPARRPQSPDEYPAVSQSEARVVSANQKPGLCKPIRSRGLNHLGDVSELGEADYVTEDGGPLERVDGLVVGGQEGGDRLPGRRVVVHPVVTRAQLVQEEQASLAGSWVSESV